MCDHGVASDASRQSLLQHVDGMDRPVQIEHRPAWPGPQSAVETRAVSGLTDIRICR